MAKFSVPDPNDDVPVKPAMDEVRAMNGLPPLPPPTIVNPNALPASTIVQQNPTSIPVMTVGDSSMGSAMMSQQTVQMQAQTASAQAQAQVGLAQAAIDNKVVDEQIKKEEEHWMKQYWRPAMGWLYMLMCLMDFVIFPIIAMMMPIIMKAWGIQANYVAWQSLTLSNGGLIHLAFGAILGVSAWTRGQEKLAKIN
jgi:uncharacterized membrane protein